MANCPEIDSLDLQLGPLQLLGVFASPNAPLKDTKWWSQYKAAIT